MIPLLLKGYKLVSRINFIRDFNRAHRKATGVRGVNYSPLHLCVCVCVFFLYVVFVFHIFRSLKNNLHVKIECVILGRRDGRIRATQGISSDIFV